MNPVEIGTGRSFKGLAAYLLHDPARAATAERVGWMQSFNLDDAGPETSWRLMAATAQSADALKAASGIKKGKTAKNTAYHFSLNFNPADNATEEVERRAVESALKALGLDQYQALAVSHTDTAHRHVHVMVNLIHPENGMSAASKQPDGRASPLSNSQRKLSAWAATFEREHALEVTQGRLANANKRAEGEKVDARRKPRNVYEREQKEGQDRRLLWLKKQETEKAAALTAEGRELRERNRTAWEAMKAAYALQKDAIREDKDRRIKATIEDIKAARKPAWAALFMTQRSELQDFERGEKSAIGRIWHAAAVVKDRALDGDLLGGFVAAFSKEERIAIVARKHDQERKALSDRQRREMTAAIDAVKAENARSLAQARTAFLADCRTLKDEQDTARDELRERWKDYNADRRELFQKAQRQSAVSQTRGQGMGMHRGMEP